MALVRHYEKYETPKDDSVRLRGFGGCGLAPPTASAANTGGSGRDSQIDGALAGCRSRGGASFLRRRRVFRVAAIGRNPGPAKRELARRDWSGSRRVPR